MLIDRSPKRLFAFGCSFTEYYWPTWTEILSLDLDIPCYNYGKSGAGNQYISNMLVQADHFYKFNKDDLIIISWSSVCREDRWKDRNWITPGNIYTQGEYSQEWVKEWADPLGYLVRDLATISLTKNYLENRNCNWKMFSMCDLVVQLDQQAHTAISADNIDSYNKLLEIYKKDIGVLMPSFFNILWNNDVYKNKVLVDFKKFDNKYSDGHPTPKEHLEYLQCIFPEHQFKNNTIKTVENSDLILNNFISEKIKTVKNNFAMYKLSELEIKNLKKIISIKPSLMPQRI